MSAAVFVDTSAFFALIVTSDEKHDLALSHWKQLLAENPQIVTTNYVIVESIALIQNRSGLANVSAFLDNFLPLLEIIWIGQHLHADAVNSVLTANRRHLSLVDCSSFATMRRLRIESVFTFDEHFKEQGFTVVP